MGWLAAECEVAGHRICSSKSDAMVLSWKTVKWPLQVRGELLLQVKEFKCLEVLVTSDRRVEQEIKRWAWAMRRLQQYVTKL